MNATFKQLETIQNLNLNYKIDFLEYGFYSNGTISAKCKDTIGLFCITINKYGKIIN